MTKSFAQCSLPDLAHEIYVAACDATSSALNPSSINLILPSLTSFEITERALRYHPLVRGLDGFVCSGSAQSRQAWCSMLRDLFSASGAAVSDAALLRVYLVCKGCARRGYVRVCAFISSVLSHPAAAAAGHELLAQLTAHPILCLASQINFARWRAMLRGHTPSPAHAPHWHVASVKIGQQQRRAVLCGAALLRVLVPRLLRVQGKYGVIYPLNLARRIASRRHFLGSKLHQAEGVFEEGQRLYGEQRFSEAAERWEQAALLQHGPSHAHLSSMAIEGRAGFPKDMKRAFVLAAAGAALGCAHSKGALGRCYASGEGVARDSARGLALGRESEAEGSCFGQYVVGLCREAGWGALARDYSEAVRLYRLAAAQGHAAAQKSLGYLIQKGRGLAQDKEEAVRFYRLAAEQGHAEAEQKLAYMISVGRGVAQDYAEAARLFRLAAAQGDAYSQKSLGYMFQRGGRGVAQDHAEAARFYRLAAAQGDVYSQKSLGYMYQSGQGVVLDYSEAARLYRLAAAQGDAFSQKSLGRLFESGRGVARCIREAVRLYGLAAAQGEAGAQCNLGALFHYGRGVAQDYAEAVRLYGLAAAQGHAAAQFNLGAMHENGHGVDQDHAEAVRLYRLAAAQGHAAAASAIARMGA
jgi:uncharacterized protein